MIHTAVIAAAGKGTRLLPFSAFVPKEMIPLGSVPVIQYVVEELFEAGVNRIIVITDSSKDSLIRFFDVSVQKALLPHIKNPVLAKRQKAFIKSLENAEIIVDFQTGHYGNATPLLVAAQYLQEEPFFYTWADDFIQATPSRFTQLARTYDIYKTTVLSGVRAVLDTDYELYAYIESEHIDDDVSLLRRIHEKPGKAQTPSDMGVLSGHLFNSDVLHYIRRSYEHHNPGDGEFLFNTILHAMIDDGYKIVVKEIDNSEYIDTGNIESYYKSFGKFLKEGAIL